MTSPLAANARIVAGLRDRLKEQYTLDDGDEVLETTLEGETDLPEQLARLARHLVWVEGQADAMKAIIQANKERKARFEAKGEKLRATIAWALSEAGMKKIPADALPDLTVSMHEGQAPLWLEDGEIPSTLCRVKLEPDRKKIREYVETYGNQLWAGLGNPMPILTIRGG